MGGTQSLQQVPTQNLGLKVANSQVLGRNYVTDVSGRSLYIYTKDPANKSVCSGHCAEEWPPVLIPSPLAGNWQQAMNQGIQNPVQNQTLQSLINQVQAPGVNKSKLGLTPRNDGSIQLTLNSWPLYYYYMDANPGDIKGQTVRGIWYLIGPEGNPIVTPLIPQYQPDPNPEGALEGEYASGAVAKGAPLPEETPEDETAANNTVSYAQNWKSNVGYRNFRHYYRGKKWRYWAQKNKKNWRDHNEHSRWYRDNKDKWADDYIRGVYVIWLKNPENDWDDFNDWQTWHNSNINPYY